MSRTEFGAQVVQEEVQKEFTVVGTEQRRHDGGLKVSGSAIFGTDIELPNMLHGKIFRSTEAHARIKNLDESGAENYTGVRAVVTARDYPEVTHGIAEKDEHILPRDTV